MSTAARTASPALQLLLETGIWHRVYTYDHKVSDQGFGYEAAEKLQIAPERIYKTLLVESSERELANAVVAVADMLNLKRLAAALGTKRVEMANPNVAQQKTGYVLGGISPLGQKTQLPIVVDASVEPHDTIWISGGRRGLSIEIRADDFLRITSATVADISR
ncbi:MAG TPA: Cys-tRNA(Pro) deacylase [Enteractinococcus helveticum]|uniref:Cys-tRNA(Pro)/Cys-tRNA(Cys) deacylase n=1 Tax=Enteractinococcus helveticum TaxID=1837282 RepID=A0A921FP27_9MICC|nr:Cys-tRNA(Pro) deacylase [Enteractinococcus helveticum]HJF14306.1 Cys-tRNA(Pro) deacylase [Enteractinococcus helveticum]